MTDAELGETQWLPILSDSELDERESALWSIRDYTPDQLKVRAFVRHYAPVFIARDWTAAQAAELALISGLNAQAVYAVLCEYKYALKGENIDIGAKEYLYKFEGAVELADRMKGDLAFDLRRQWEDVNKYLYEGVTW